MCLKLEVTLPTIENFLLMYTLRVGCIIILVWTMLRSLLCYLFFVDAILEILLKRKLVPILVTDPKAKIIDKDSIMIVYFIYIGMLLAESFLFVASWYLARGLYLYRSDYFVPYLVCRMATWAVEVLLLVVLCIIHKFLIGWYLGILFFVILEFYAFIVVYSYYCELWDCDHPCKQEDDSSHFNICSSS
ncbi:uncharacterized protein LOC114366414 isoform X1 [Ostrinia furnacalis]|uniref:uncharacterized protein LOC114366414 isoform X1 n=1 Tax=Ostrinia furnacalis TaxID=93504 RepID=UPI00103B74F3|nr:uncharacterized protein LOC114366414 isoform X1 [Ostrinia furnacalis]